MLRDENHQRIKIILIAISLLATLWVQAPRLADPFRVDEDFRSFYWMNMFQEQGLFPNDPLRGHPSVNVRLPWGEMLMFQEQGLFPNDPLRGHPSVNVRLPWGDVFLYFHSLGYYLLFYAASFFVSPLSFTKLLPLLLVPITVCYLFEWGRSVGDRNGATALAGGFLFLNLTSPTSLSMLSGIQRGFTCSLMIVLVYYLHRRRPLAAASTVFVSALIYPPVFLLGAVTSGLFFLTLPVASPPSLRVAKQGLVALLIGFCIGAVVLSPLMLSGIRGALGADSIRENLVTGNTVDGQVLTQPAYQSGGRYQLFLVFPIIGRGGLVTKLQTALHLVILMTIASLICLVQRPLHSLSLPREIWCVLLGGLALFAAAWASALLTGSFLVYEPSRYTRAGLFLFLSLFVLLNISDAMKESARLLRSHANAMLWLAAGLEVVAVGCILLYRSSRMVLMGINMKWLLTLASLLVAILGALSFRRRSVRAAPTNPRHSALARVFIGAFLAISLVAWGAYARATSGASTLDPPSAERELLAFLETLPKDALVGGSPCALDNVPLFAKRQILFSCEHVSEDDDLMSEALDVWYAEEADTVLDFCSAHGVDYLVVNRHAYSRKYIDQGWLFFEPYNEELLPRVRARDSFALARVADSAKVFESGDLFVVPCTEVALR